MSQRLRVWTCNDHPSVWVGGASVVVAATEAEARHLLIEELSRHGLPCRPRDQGNPMTLVELPLTTPSARVLQNGDY